MKHNERYTANDYLFIFSVSHMPTFVSRCFPQILHHHHAKYLRICVGDCLVVLVSLLLALASSQTRVTIRETHFMTRSCPFIMFGQGLLFLRLSLFFFPVTGLLFFNVPPQFSPACYYCRYVPSTAVYDTYISLFSLSFLFFLVPLYLVQSI